MEYISTRGGDCVHSTKEAILRGIAADGGLFMPKHLPAIQLEGKENYHSIAKKVFSAVFNDLTESELQYCIEKAYDKKFDGEQIVPIVSLGNRHIMELYHGPTCAFKDFALTILPYFMKLASKEVEEEIAVLTATSGDTGKAALEGFRDVEGTKVIVFYPTEGVSEVQRLQMVTQEGKNTYAIGIYGNFDEAQSALKKVFNDRKQMDYFRRKKILLSSANSINIGRLVPQIIYYFYAYYQLVQDKKISVGEQVNIAVPTGNFGDILAAYLAGEMGLPLYRFICASNRNHVLTDFFEQGRYDRKRKFYKTNSPSMDILISSNLERLLFLKSKGDTCQVKKWMEQLNSDGYYVLSENMKKSMSDFYGYYLDDEQTLQVIRKYFEQYHYLLDTHTAVCMGAVEQYEEQKHDLRPIIVASTASPYKFPKDVGEALGLFGDEFSQMDQISEISGIPIPKNLKNIEKKEITQTLVIDKKDIVPTIVSILGE